MYTEHCTSNSVIQGKKRKAPVLNLIGIYNVKGKEKNVDATI
jgi:hypothetical protein